MFTILQGHTFKSVFDALTWMEENEIKGGVKDINGKKIVSWSSKSRQHNWHIQTPLTTEKAAFLLGLSKIRINQFCNEGRMGHRFGKSWAITIEELEKFANEKRPSGIGFHQQPTTKR